ncbi:alpha-isopropylmalate synthase regulatory domain-containing protein [Terrilactibacillus sp. S3-3]|nr:alpha-isopropylmalate synthase regulatory domain-containing protein [Terrilactibacillus sp. S3-3]
MYQAFKNEYVNLEEPLTFRHYVEQVDPEHRSSIEATLDFKGKEVSIQGTGNGIIDAFCQGLGNLLKQKIDIVNYSEHAMEFGSTSKAITYIQLRDDQGDDFYGAGIANSVSRSSLLAVVSAANRMLQTKAVPMH